VGLLQRGSRLDLVNGKPVPTWHDPEAKAAFEALKNDREKG